jgi:hypothetical protein
MNLCGLRGSFFEAFCYSVDLLVGVEENSALLFESFLDGLIAGQDLVQCPADFTEGCVGRELLSARGVDKDGQGRDGSDVADLGIGPQREGNRKCAEKVTLAGIA